MDLFFSFDFAAARTVMAEVFSFLTAWLAPITCFTAEEAWLASGVPQDVLPGLRSSLLTNAVNWTGGR